VLLATDVFGRMMVAQILRTFGIVTGVLLLDYALARSQVPYGPFVEGGWVVALLAAQVGLCSVWASISRDHWLARLVILLAVSAGVWAFLVRWNHRAQSELSPAFWVQGVIVVGGLLLTRVMRFRLIRSSEVRSEPSIEQASQFSIRDLIIVITLVCVALAATVRMGSLSVETDAPRIACGIGVFLAAITLLSVGATLVLRHMLLPVALILGGSVLLGWGIGKAIHYDLVVSTVALGAPAMLQLAVLVLLRLSGNRFVRPISDATVKDRNPGENGGRSSRYRP
jgi:hypothetical protein